MDYWRRRERQEREERQRLARRAFLQRQEDEVHRAEEARRAPFRAMASLFGHEDPYAWEDRRPEMKPIDTLKAALRDLTPQHETLARAVRRWTPAPPKPGEFDNGSRPALDGSDLDGSPPEYVLRKRREAQAALRIAEGSAVGTLNALVAEAAKEPAARFEQGTQLDADHRAETMLLVEQFRGLPRQQQADLITQGQKALDRGDLQAALAVKRAADVLHVSSAELDEALVKADTVRASAREELASIEKLVNAWHGDVARRHINAGMADDTETVGLVGFAKEHGFAHDGGAPYVEQALGQPSGK